MGSHVSWAGTPSLAFQCIALPGLLNTDEAWSLSAGFIKSLALWVTCFVALDFWLKNIYYLKVSGFMNIKDYAPVVSLKAKVDVDELFILLLVWARI